MPLGKKYPVNHPPLKKKKAPSAAKKPLSLKGERKALSPMRKPSANMKPMHGAMQLPVQPGFSADSGQHPFISKHFQPPK